MGAFAIIFEAFGFSEKSMPTAEQGFYTAFFVRASSASAAEAAARQLLDAALVQRRLNRAEDATIAVSEQRAIDADDSRIDVPQGFIFFDETSS